MSNRRTRLPIRVTVDIDGIEIPEAWNPIHDDHPMDFAEGLVNFIQLLPEVARDTSKWSYDELLSFTHGSLHIILAMINYVKANRKPILTSATTPLPRASNRLPARNTSPEPSQPLEESIPDLESPSTLSPAPAKRAGGPAQTEDSPSKPQRHAYTRHSALPAASTGRVAAKAVPAADTEEAVPTANTEKVASTNNTEKAVPAANTEEAVPTANTEKVASTNNTEKAAPKANTEKAAPKANTAKAAPKANTEKAAPKANTAKAAPKANTARAAPKANTVKARGASAVAAITIAVPDPNEIKTSAKHTRDEEKTVGVTTRPKRRRLAEQVGRQNKAEDMDPEVVKGSEQSGFESEGEHHDVEEDTDEGMIQLTTFPRPTNIRKFGFSVVGILADGLLHGEQMVLLEWEMPVGDPASVEICTSQCKTARTNTLMSALDKLEDKPLPRQQLSDMDLRGVNWCQCIRSRMNKAGHRMEGAAADSWLSSLLASSS